MAHLQAPTRTLWASVNSRPDKDVSKEFVWRVFVNRKDAGEVERFDMLTFEAFGWDALEQVDTALQVHGYTRSSDWEIGSGHGFVAWIEPS